MDLQSKATREQLANDRNMKPTEEGIPTAKNIYKVKTC